MSTRPLLFIYNLLQDIIDTFKVMEQGDKFILENEQTSWYNQNELLGIISEFPNRPKYYFVFSNQIDQCFIAYASKLLQIPREKIEILVPRKGHNQLLGSICEYIAHDGSMIQNILNMPQFDIVSYCMSEPYLNLCDILKTKANPIQFTSRQNWQQIKRLGTKPGIRQLIRNMNDPKIVMPKGKIFYASQNSYQNCINVICSKLRTQNVVVKTQKLLAGNGVFIFKHNQFQHLCDEQLRQHIKQKMNKPYWKVFDIVVENYVNVDFSVGPPCVEIFINIAGQVKLVWISSMIIEDQTKFIGIQSGKQNYSKETYQKLVYCAMKLGEVYAGLGYKGYINVDFNIDKSGQVFVGQSNVRRSASLFIHNFVKYQNEQNYKQKFYLMTHDIKSQRLKTLKFAELVEQVECQGLHYMYQMGVGAVLSSCESFKNGLLQYFTITNTRKQALQLNKKIVHILERENQMN